MKKPPDLTSDLLKRVSRSFYLSLAVLPASVRPILGLAYLFARAADTIADTRLIDRELRITHLLAFRGELDILVPGRLAALVGDTAGAIRVYREYLDLRRFADSLLLPQRDSVAAVVHDRDHHPPVVAHCLRLACGDHDTRGFQGQGFLCG